MYSVFSFFSGCGLLDLGFEKAGFNIVFVNELSNSFLNAYKYSRKKMGCAIPRYGFWETDINKYLYSRREELDGFMNNARSNGDIIGYIGGPPCPDFSVGGKNRGKDGERGKLSLSYIKLIVNMQPDWFLFENVKGLWRTAKHRAFYDSLKEILEEGGYEITERLTNSFEYGVPQDRDRILLFGINKAYTNCSPRLPWEKCIVYKLALMKSEDWPKQDIFIEGSKTVNPNPGLAPLTVQHWFDINNVDNHPNSNKHFIPRAGIEKMRTIAEGDVSKKSYKRLHRWRYSPTVAYGNNEVHLHPYRERRISVAEALAIQSLPKEFELPQDMSLTDMFKTIGNGVPFLLSDGIAKTIRFFLEGNVCKELQRQI